MCTPVTPGLLLVCSLSPDSPSCPIRPGFPAQVLALEILILMLDKPSADSVEMACEFVKEVGAYLQEVAPQGLHRWAGGRGGVLFR